MTLLQCLVIAPRIIENIFCYLLGMVLQNHGNYTPRTTKLLEGGGGYWFHSVRLSVRLSVRPYHIPCPLCSTYSSSWIHFIFIHLIKQLQRVCRVLIFLQNLKFWFLAIFFKYCNFHFVLFWLGIWCESLVWVNMGRRGVSQNAGVLVVLVLPAVKTTYVERPPNLVVILYSFYYTNSYIVHQEHVIPDLLTL